MPHLSIDGRGFSRMRSVRGGSSDEWSGRCRGNLNRRVGSILGGGTSGLLQGLGRLRHLWGDIAVRFIMRGRHHYRMVGD